MHALWVSSNQGRCYKAHVELCDNYSLHLVRISSKSGNREDIKTCSSLRQSAWLFEDYTHTCWRIVHQASRCVKTRDSFNGLKGLWYVVWKQSNWQDFTTGMICSKSIVITNLQLSSRFTWYDVFATKCSHIDCDRPCFARAKNQTRGVLRDGSISYFRMSYQSRTAIYRTQILFWTYGTDRVYIIAEYDHAGIKVSC